MWNTNDDRNSDLGHCFENVETSIYRKVSTFLDVAYFLKVWKQFPLGQCGILTMIGTPILVIVSKCGNVYR